MQSLGDILKLLFDNTFRLSQKIAFSLGVILLVVFIDNHIGLSNSYITKSRLEQIESIENILKNKDLLEKTKLRLREIENDILFRKSYLDITFQMVNNSFVHFGNILSKQTKHSTSNGFIVTIDYLSSSLWFLVGFLYLISSFIQTADKKIQDWALLVFVVGFFFLLILFSPSIFNKLIPKIELLWLRLLTKFIVHSMVCGLILFLGTNRSKK